MGVECRNCEVVFSGLKKVRRVYRASWPKRVLDLWPDSRRDYIRPQVSSFFSRNNRSRHSPRADSYALSFWNFSSADRSVRSQTPRYKPQWLVVSDVFDPATRFGPVFCIHDRSKQSRREPLRSQPKYRLGGRHGHGHFLIKRVRFFKSGQLAQKVTFRKTVPVQPVDATPRSESEVLLKQEVLVFSGFLQHKS